MRRQHIGHQHQPHQQHQHYSAGGDEDDEEDDGSESSLSDYQPSKDVREIFNHQHPYAAAGGATGTQAYYQQQSPNQRPQPASAAQEHTHYQATSSYQPGQYQPGQYSAAASQASAQIARPTGAYDEPEIIQGYPGSMMPHGGQYQHYIPQADDSSDDESDHQPQQTFHNHQNAMPLNPKMDASADSSQKEHRMTPATDSRRNIHPSHTGSEAQAVATPQTALNAQLSPQIISEGINVRY